MISAGEMNTGGSDSMMGLGQPGPFMYRPVGFSPWANDAFNVSTELKLNEQQTDKLITHKMDLANVGMLGALGLNLVDAGAQTVLGYLTLDNEQTRYNVLETMDKNRKDVAIEQLDVQRAALYIQKDVQFAAFGLQERLQNASQKLALRIEDIRQRGQTERAELFASSQAFSARSGPFYGTPEMG